MLLLAHKSWELVSNSGQEFQNMDRKSQTGPKLLAGAQNTEKHEVFDIAFGLGVFVAFRGPVRNPRQLARTCEQSSIPSINFIVMPVGKV